MSPANSFKSISNYSLFGPTGLRVSPLCLGAMTFGNADGWGASAAVSREILDRYLDAGGNFIDTANAYQRGQSELLLGKFLSESGKRDRVVLATKFSITNAPGDPNACGNSRKNIYQSVEGSLKRLQTDYIDLYWMHFWDTLTPIEEVMETMDDLIQSGKVRYFGLSDVPAWYMARAQTYAQLRGRFKLVGAQLEYSLLDRNLEIEHADAARMLGMGICAWGPLGSGLLTGKYRRAADGTATGEGRITIDANHSRRMTGRNMQIVDALVDLAKEIGRSPTQVALNWITRRPAVHSTIIGATKVSQLEENLGALEFVIPTELSNTLEELSRPTAPHLYDFFKDPFVSVTRGGTRVSARPEWDQRA